MKVDISDSSSDDDFQNPLPVPASRPSRSSPRNKGKGKAKSQDAPRPTPEIEASLLITKLSKIDIEQDSSSSSSGHNTVFTSTCNYYGCSSNALTPANLDDAESQVDGSIMAGYSVPSQNLPSTSDQLNADSPQLSNSEIQDHDDAKFALKISPEKFEHLNKLKRKLVNNKQDKSGPSKRRRYLRDGMLSSEDDEEIAD